MAHDDDEESLAERIAHLEGVVETEDRAVERGMETVKHGQILLIGLCAITIAASVAILVYLLNRLDVISMSIHGVK
jgi:hypothetical protein